MSYSIGKINYCINFSSFGNNTMQRKLTDFGAYTPSEGGRVEEENAESTTSEGPQVVTDGTTTPRVTLQDTNIVVESVQTFSNNSNSNEIVDALKNFLLKENTARAAAYASTATRRTRKPN